MNNILCCNAGRRGRLMIDMRKTIGDSGNVVATDNWSVAPAIFFANKQYVVPKITHPNYIQEVLGICKKEDIKAIADLSIDHDFLIISDEIYEKIIYDKKHYSPAAYSDNVITINGFSKTYAMTGLRIGYLNAKEEYLEELLKIHQYNIACANSTAQRGAYEALTGPQDTVNKMVNEFKKRRDLIVSRLNEMGYKTVNAQGAFYVFPKIENPEEFVKKSAENGVITVPGAAFGQNGKNHVRMSYANSYENIVKAMDILEKGVN